MISVIVTLVNRSHHFRRMLASIVRAQRPADLEVIVVDHGSTDGDVIDIIGNEYFVGLMQRPLPFNASGARNEGAALAIGDVLAFLDADMIVPTDYFEIVQRETPPGTAFFPQCLLQDQCREISTVCTTGYGNCAVTRADFKRVGKWDEGFVAWGEEDTEFHERYRKAGISISRPVLSDLVHQYHPNTWKHRNLYTAHPNAIRPTYQGRTT